MGFEASEDRRRDEALADCRDGCRGRPRTALEIMKPGVSELALADAYNRRVSELGYTAGGQSYPIFCGQPRSRALMPYATNVLPYRKLTRDRIIMDGELISIDCGSEVHGYAGDGGRTWFCGEYNRPTSKENNLYYRWRDIIGGMLECCSSGKTGADIHRAAGNNITTYFGHSIGVGSPDGFVIGGRSISWEEEESGVIEPGMCLLMEPIIFEEGVGNFRAEEHVFITENGHEQISKVPHGPLSEQ